MATPSHWHAWAHALKHRVDPVAAPVLPPSAGGTPMSAAPAKSAVPAAAAAAPMPGQARERWKA